MLSAVTVTVTDFAAGSAFYDAALAALGWIRAAELVDEEEDGAEVEALGWGPVGSSAQLWLVRGPVPTVGLHVRLQADSPHEVESFTMAGVQHGGALRAAPRRWTVYRRGEYGATIGDPAGNLIEAVAPE